jgi:hypothetical protein
MNQKVRGEAFAASLGTRFTNLVGALRSGLPGDCSHLILAIQKDKDLDNQTGFFCDTVESAMQYLSDKNKLS